MTTRSSSSTTKQATEDLSITQDTEGTMKKDGILGINEEVEIEKVEKEVEDGRDEETWEINEKVESENTMREGLESGEKKAPSEASKWLRISPAKVGCSPMWSAQNQTEDIHISASKFSVLSVEDEEEGEIMEEMQQNTEDEDTLIRENMDEKEEAEMSVTEDKGKETNYKGIKRNQKEKKAKSHDANLIAMGTRSSRRKF